MSEQCPIHVPCQAVGQTQTPFSDAPATPITTPGTPIVKIPVVLAERTTQIVVESDVPLDPPAVEIKRVLKNHKLAKVISEVSFTISIHVRIQSKMVWQTSHCRIEIICFQPIMFLLWISKQRR
ncbi:hypothetical protein IIA_05382 [Bacillus cereus VD014]|uniref:Uncharacterized protein n=1 Tax=Bacillus cereus (strain VD014) TaxID=1053223 RepID=A0A9W5K2K7_BACC8|nr:hypothetical protein IIA_05382 [Bacillus cereus VD014]KLA26287.1 hypothetical protein B4080_6393 [Bacillus cereus]